MESPLGDAGSFAAEMQKTSVNISAKFRSDSSTNDLSSVLRFVENATQVRTVQEKTTNY